MSERALEHELKWHTSYWPFLLGFGVLFLVPLAFIFHFVYNNPLMTVVSLGVGTPLTLISIAGWIKEGMEDVHGYSEGHVVLAMPFFILAEALLFVGFFAAYWGVRLSQSSWPPDGTPEKALLVPILMTIILVSSSFTIHYSEKKLEKGDRGGFISWLMITILLGVVFLGLSGYEWNEFFSKGFNFKTNVYSSAFFSITGFHGSHVLVGVSVFICMLIPALMGKISDPFVRAASMYWHFVDIVWLFVVSQVYFW